jgi:hypothetical protein
MNSAFAVAAAILSRIFAKRRPLLIALILFQFVHASYSQTDSVQVLSSAFTREQVAVYHAFLADHRRGDDARTINVAEQTDILEPDEGDYSGCMKGIAGWLTIASNDASLETRNLENSRSDG